MFNLLPPTEKKGIKKEYLFRFASIGIGLVAASLFIFLILLLPSYFLSSEKERAVELNQRVTQEALHIKDGNVLEEVAKEANEELQLFKDLGEKKAFYELVRDIVFQKGAGITLRSFTVRTVEAKNATYKELSLAGVARERTSLLEFSKMIGGLPGIVKVDLPVSNFTKETDIEFSIKAEGKF